MIKNSAIVIILPYLASSPLHCVQGLVSVVEFFWWGWDINLMDGTSLNLEDQLLQFICPFIQICRSLRNSHFHFLLGQAGQARKTCKAEMSKTIAPQAKPAKHGWIYRGPGSQLVSFQSHQGTQTSPSQAKKIFFKTQERCDWNEKMVIGCLCYLSNRKHFAYLLSLI